MISLPNVTLCCLTNQKFPEHLLAMEKSSEGIKWGARKIIFDMDCDSIGKWNEKIIKELPKYIDTDFAMLIHADGYVINPDCWRDEWLQYDYTGAPWPLPKDDYSYRDEEGGTQRVGNSVSLRSKRLMDLIATRPMEYHYGNNNEDGQICCWNRKWLEQYCTFAPLSEAVLFSREHDVPEHNMFKGELKTFAFHSI